MQFDSVNIAIRHRTGWEAIDLGFALAQREARAVWTAWFACALPAFIAIQLVGWHTDHLLLATLAFWWIKPLLDRPVLDVLSHAVFGPPPPLRATLGRMPRSWLQALPGALLWARFDLARSFDLPVNQLEGARGLTAWRRMTLLQGTMRRPAVYLTVACANLEQILMFACGALVLMFVPFEFLSETARLMYVTFLEEVTPGAQLALNTLYFLVVSAVEPFYVSAGFTLYLNRRTELEAWDVEIVFRRLVRRLAPVAGAAVLVLAVVLAPLPTSAATIRSPNADETVATAELVDDDALPPASRYRAAAAAVERDSDLNPVEQAGTWERIGAEDDARASDVPAWQRNLTLTIAFIIQHVWWLAVLGACVAVFLTRGRWLPYLAPATDQSAPAAPQARHAASTRERLPADVPGSARALWHAGDRRAALSLVYRACLARVSSARPLPPGATEDDCLLAASRLGAEAREVTVAAVRVWQLAAYARRYPDDAAFDALLARWSAS